MAKISKIKLAIVDVDETLLDIQNRVVKKVPLSAIYYGYLDKPYPEAKEFIKFLLDNNFYILFLTGRPQEERDITIYQLISNGFVRPEILHKKAFLITHKPKEKKDIDNYLFKIMVLLHLLKHKIKPFIWVEDSWTYVKDHHKKLDKVLQRLNIIPLWLKNRNSWKENLKNWIILVKNKLNRYEDRFDRI